MEKRSRRRIRDLVAPAAFQGLSQNEIGCARISMMARSTNAPFKGRIQKRKTNHLQIITFGLQRTAGPYKGANGRHRLGTTPLPPCNSLPIARNTLASMAASDARNSSMAETAFSGISDLPPPQPDQAALSRRGSAWGTQN